MDNDKTLYHYTNVDVLASILKNKTIRFNSLDKMDDLQEKETADLKNIGQFCYVSSWTEDKTENIPMWEMYTNIDMGVRISLKRNPFKWFDNNASDLEEILKATVKEDSNGQSMKSIIPISDMISKHFITMQAINGNLLFQVQYTNDKGELYPQMIHYRNRGCEIGMGLLGKYKSMHWKFQKEWRYIMTAIPFSWDKAPEDSFNDFNTLLVQMLQGEARQPFPYYDLTISDEAFANMEITMSPRISDGGKIIVESIVKKYNPAAIIEDSTLTGLI